MADGLPCGPADLTPGWLSAALARPVTAVRTEPLSHDRAFSGGLLLRLHLSGPGAPETLVAKLAPARPDLRRHLAAANAREVAFYARLAADTPGVAGALFAAVDGAGGSVLILPDLSDHAALPLVAGCPVVRADAAVRALARIHARWWNAPAPAALPPADLARDFGFAALWPGFRTANPSLPPPLVALGDRLAAGATPSPAPATLVHRDAHLENVLFTRDGAALWLDWQMAGWGAGATDLAYFLAASLPPDARRQSEDALVAAWHAELAAAGVTGYGLAQALRDYRGGLGGKLVLTVVATATFDNAGPARAAYRRADLDRLCAFAADHLSADGTPRLR
ncbi:MAG: phosphotransferase [Paracoccaceae bacterium]|nr:MAG: phosphotransferase [Paracoccaceae bacterium]